MQNEECVNQLENSNIDELIMLNSLNTEKNHSDRIVRLSLSKVLAQYLDELVKKDIISDSNDSNDSNNVNKI